MDRFTVTVDEDGHHATYGQPGLIGMEISDDRLRLSFDPGQMDATELEYDLSQLLQATVSV